MKCLDSDFLIAILRGDIEAKTTGIRIDQEGKTATTVINAFDILFGAKKSKNLENLKEANRLLARLEILTFDFRVSEQASDIMLNLEERGEMIDLKDIFVAAMARVNGYSIITRNTKHFSKIEELEIEKW